LSEKFGTLLDAEPYNPDAVMDALAPSANLSDVDWHMLAEIIEGRVEAFRETQRKGRVWEREKRDSYEEIGASL
jgi:hypothetical protein